MKKIPNLNNQKTSDLKAAATFLAGNRGKEEDDTYTKIIKVLARRLKSDTKKVRRQARTGFFKTH